MRNQKAKDRWADRKGRKGKEDRRERREEEDGKEIKRVFVHLFLGLRLQMGIR